MFTAHPPPHHATTTPSSHPKPIIRALRVVHNLNKPISPLSNERINNQNTVSKKKLRDKMFFNVNVLKLNIVIKCAH